MRPFYLFKNVASASKPCTVLVQGKAYLTSFACEAKRVTSSFAKALEDSSSKPWRSRISCRSQT